jgi:hypothetical protein
MQLENGNTIATIPAEYREMFDIKIGDLYLIKEE